MNTTNPLQIYLARKQAELHLAEAEQNLPPQKNLLEHSKRFLPLIPVLLYAIVRFGFTTWLDSFGDYGSYAFELLFVLTVGYIYRRELKFRISFFSELIKGFLPAAILGALVFLTMGPLHLILPFDLRSTETLLFLLILGPLLEELIFRMALWEPLLPFTQNISKYAILPISILFFAYGHFHSYWFVPEELKSFVIFQTIYVMGLAAYCGFRRIQTGSISAAILVHMGFNLGFFIASFI